jgi:hypothetical protein
MIDGDDENFFRIMFPAFWEIENDNEKARALESANMVNSEYKCGKVVFRESSDGYKDMYANVEVFLNAPNDFKPLFPRMLSLLQDMVDSFGEKMKKGEE